MQISEATRKHIIDLFSIEKTHWAGSLNDLEFLQRLFNLEPSDSRDIWKHCVDNDDWMDNWVFTDPRFNLLHCDDNMFLRFLCETIHPVVRIDAEQIRRLEQAFNLLLRDQGYEIVSNTQISGRAVYTARRISLGAESNLRSLKQHFCGTDTQYVLSQINRMQSAIENDPILAIGTAKELIETICKTILSERGQEIENNLELPKLVKQTVKELKLTPDDIPNEAKARENIQRILSNLATITNGIAELRNSYGTGHGKDSKAKGLGSRHAKLAVGAASTLAEFLLDTHNERSL
ncbi:abortive infection family protein [Microcoleus sp. AR_TQ3_B6]|uniref:abortive infection family protein n=1 Tax=Microcoleus sp. AR_TQ3_B6 TaxID=3055284 RepID=UPI002FD371EB